MENSPPKIVGITGGIGSGKSTVCKIWETLGAKVYYADDRTKWLMAHDQSLIYKITDLLGEEAYTHGALNRDFIASQVFHSHELLQQLNDLVHPMVRKDFEAWTERHREQHPILLKEAALLFETGSYTSLDQTILVVAPQEIRLKRVLSRDPHRDEKQVMAIMEKQMPEKQKMSLASFTIENDGTKALIPQVIDLHTQLTIRS